MDVRAWLVVPALLAAAACAPDGSGAIEVPTSATSRSTTAAVDDAPGDQPTQPTQPTRPTRPTIPVSTESVGHSATPTTVTDTCRSEPQAPPSLVDGADPGPPVRRGGDEDAPIYSYTGSSGELAEVRQVIEPTMDETTSDPIAAVVERDGWRLVTRLVIDDAVAEPVIDVWSPEGCRREYRIAATLGVETARRLAERWIDHLASGAPIPDDRHPELPAPVPYVGLRYDQAFPHDGLVFVVHDMGPDGSDRGPRSDDELIAAAGVGVDVGRGRRLMLAPPPAPYGRCRNRDVLATVAGDADTELSAVVGPARSLVGTPGGVVVVGRDVCPVGLRWGDSGTYHEMVRLDLDDPGVPIRQIARVDADPDRIVVDDGDGVWAAPDHHVESISPDGRFVGVVEWFNSEQRRWLVYDTESPGAPVEVPSSCDEPGSIAETPRFPRNDVLVVARTCPAASAGPVVVEAITLPDLAVAWSRSVPDTPTDGYGTTLVGLSALDVEGEVWVLVSGGGFEEQIRSVLLTRHDSVEVTHFGFGPMAFSVTDLFTPNEPIRP